MKTTRKLITICAFLAGAVAMPSIASAAKPGPLVGEPIVRKKLQYRKFRFQVTPFVGMSLSQPFVHMGYAGVRLGTHFAEWVGVRGTFAYGVVALDSQLLRAVNDGGLPTGVEPGTNDLTFPGAPACPGDGPPCRELGESDNPAPLVHDFKSGLTRAQWQGSLDAVFTPFSGKLGLFSAAFTQYDIYIFGGLGLMGWSKHYKDSESTAEILGVETDPSSPTYCAVQGQGQNSECLLHPVSADTGVKVGGSFGAGVNLMVADWIAVNLEIQDIVTSNNLAGLNTTFDDIPPVVNKDDKDVFHNVTMQVGARFYIPFKAKRTK